jgi:hypothetical protein
MMGFHINMKEVFENLRRLQSSAQKQADAADKASHGFQNIVSTNAFQGATGEAVKNNAANVHVPVQKAIKDMDKLLVQEYEQTISDFQSSVKETDANAILDENILQDLSRDLEKLIDENNQISKKFAQIYHSVDDIVALKNPSTTNFNSAVRESKKVLTDTIQSVNQFEAGGKSSSVDELASATKSQLNRAKSVGGMAYSDVRLQDAFKDNTFTKAVDKVDKQISLAEKAARQKAIKEQKKRQADWGKKHPVASWLEEKAAGIGNWWERNVTKGGAGISAKHLFKDIIKSGRQFMDGGLSLTNQVLSSVAVGARNLSKLGTSRTKKNVSVADMQKLGGSQLLAFNGANDKLKNTFSNQPKSKELQAVLKSQLAMDAEAKRINTIRPDDKITTVNVSYNYNGENYTTGYVINERTNRIIVASGESPLKSLTSYTKGGAGLPDDNLAEVPQIDPKDYPGTPTALGVAGTAGTVGEVYSSVKETASTVTGKDYIEQQTQEKAFIEEQRKFRQQQDLNPNGR